jgi:hypothetical protein
MVNQQNTYTQISELMHPLLCELSYNIRQMQYSHFLDGSTIPLQIIANRAMVIPLRELRRLIRLRLGEARDVVGYDIAALKLIARVARERQHSFAPIAEEVVDVWAGMGLGSDVAAAMQARGRKRNA